MSAEPLVAASGYSGGAAYDHLDGWLLMEIEPHVVVRDFDIMAWTSSKEFLGEMKGALDYAKGEKSVPKLDMVHFEIFDKDGKSGRDYRAKVRSLIFGPVAPEQFTLPGSGFGADMPMK